MARTYTKLLVHCVYSTKNRRNSIQQPERVSPGAVPAVIRYIENQERHHSRKNFETEYLEMLNRAGIDYAPEYVLD